LREKKRDVNELVVASLALAPSARLRCDNDIGDSIFYLLGNLA